MMSKNTGTITQVVGVVVDVEFDKDNLPAIYDALEATLDGKTLVFEVAQHLDERSAVSAKLIEWKEKWENSSWECKQYQDVFLYLTRFPGKQVLEGQLVQLSVAPTSVKIYTRACLTAKGRGRSPHETVFKIGVGEKIRGEFDYYPWSFECIGSCQKLGGGTEVTDVGLAGADEALVDLGTGDG
jgi:hypothetical protein